MAKSTSLVDYAGSLLCSASPMFLPLLTRSPSLFQYWGTCHLHKGAGGVWLILAPSLPGRGWWRPRGQNPRAENQPNPAPCLVQKEQVITKWNKKRNTQKNTKSHHKRNTLKETTTKKKGEKTKRDTPGKKHKTTKSNIGVSRYPKNEIKKEFKKEFKTKKFSTKGNK